MPTRPTLALCLALTSIACTTPAPPPPAADPGPPPVAAPTTQAELEQLRAENKRLREQVYGAKQETARAENRVAAVEAEQTAIARGKLEPGMTVQQASRAVNGEAELHGDVVTLVSQSPQEWVYKIRTGAPTFGPGSTGTAPLGTNMRAARPTPVQTWLCTFDATTGKLTSFKPVAN